jgi:hypothetical protein
MGNYGNNGYEQKGQGNEQKQYTYKSSEETLHWIDKKMFKVLDALDKIVELLSRK